MANYNITDLVKNAIKDEPLPANYRDLDETTKRRLSREAEAKGTSPEALYEAIKAQASMDAADDFDPAAIAKAARR